MYLGICTATIAIMYGTYSYISSIYKVPKVPLGRHAIKVSETLYSEKYLTIEIYNTREIWEQALKHNKRLSKYGKSPIELYDVRIFVPKDVWERYDLNIVDVIECSEKSYDSTNHKCTNDISYLPWEIENAGRYKVIRIYTYIDKDHICQVLIKPAKQGKELTKILEEVNRRLAWWHEIKGSVRVEK